MYSGAGSAPLLDAASAWGALAGELRVAAQGYRSSVAALSASWAGPSSTAMAEAAAPYIAWLANTADRAEQFSLHAATAAAAYETAFAATVPPPVIATNRATLAAINIVGQNAAAIAATEAQYAAMWSTDTAAMYRYAAQSAAATTMQPVDPAPQTTNPGATSAHTTAHISAIPNTIVQTALAHLTSATPHALQTLATPTTAATNPTTPLGALTNFLTTLEQSPLEKIAANAEIVPQAILPTNSSLINTIMDIAIGTKARDIAAAAGSAATGLNAALSATTPPTAAGLAAATSPVSAQLGQAASIGTVSVPSTWATATPAVRTLAAALSNAAPDTAVPAVALSQSTLLTGVRFPRDRGGISYKG